MVFDRGAWWRLQWADAQLYRQEHRGRSRKAATSIGQRGVGTLALARRHAADRDPRAARLRAAGGGRYAILT